MAIDRGEKEKEPDVEELLTELEHKIDRLKILYEQYFMGIERIEPQTPRKEITRKMLEITQLNIRNTGIRYRFNALGQKWGVYQTYWNRTLREIENGTYMKAIARAGRHAARKGQEIPEEMLMALPKRLRERLIRDRENIRAQDARDEAKRQAKATAKGKIKAGDVPSAIPASAASSAPANDSRMFGNDGAFDETFESLFDTLSGGETSKVTRNPLLPEGNAPAVPLRPATAPKAAGTGPPKKGPTLPAGVAEAEARDLFKKYVQAKELVGEDTSSVRYEQIVHTIAKQAPRIMEQHQAKGVDFQVVIKDNKVILKATPRK
jgi:hypothetical protein